MELRIRFTAQRAINAYKLMLQDEHMDFSVNSDNTFFIHNVTSFFYDITDTYTVFCENSRSCEICACDIRVLEIKEGE